MNDNQDNEEDIELEEEVLSDKHDILNKKKQEEIINERSKRCDFNSEDPQSLEIKENEPFFRTPLADIIESEDVYYVLVELPGLDKKHVEISLQEGVLEILGEKAIRDKEKKEEKKDKDKKEKKDEKKDKDKKKEKYKEIKGSYLRREIRSTNFFRCFQLPEDIFPEEIDASFKNGILRLKIPKRTAHLGDKKVIEIK
ncbi:MAG: Hsp20/alpha crystallin family protein [Candidatus Hermodarchaeota archaeon]